MTWQIRKISHLVSSVGASLTAPLLRGLRLLQRWHCLGRERRQLASLSDAALKDLGLSRADIVQETQRPFWDDPLAR
ncbi:DUF1127 domain-containing protein [Pseudomonas sp. 5P_3.1_Bac2]|uniref:DUF1127 domain-containing protein n=1 Tax=Pseudomonas sp. 5P_3.1_Bac2 TaxID=2971617 RepID=UPI0021C57603|nr:DUF1127 domain-containing protein [Pseudomonas sp. 5P_3.1_Bac2]MCU1718704.1 DUF1127 domain-containing protein [Pseudomonas sp. 5P_3.1_Bac2]